MRVIFLRAKSKRMNEWGIHRKKSFFSGFVVPFLCCIDTVKHFFFLCMPLIKKIDRHAAAYYRTFLSLTCIFCFQQLLICTYLFFPFIQHACKIFSSTTEKIKINFLIISDSIETSMCSPFAGYQATALSLLYLL